MELTNSMVSAATPLGDWLAVAPIIILLGTGALLMMLRAQVKLQAPIAIGAMALSFASGLGLLVRVHEQGFVIMTMGRWLPPFGISLSVDLLGALFAATALLVGLACVVSAHWTISDEQRRFGFFPFLLLTTAGVTGAFLTGDVFNLYVWFEVFLIASFGLLVIGSSRAQLDGTLKYAVLNLVATTLFLIATAYLYGIFGTLNMADVVRKLGQVETAPLMTLAALYLLAFSMKAAAFPVHAWLPASYHTPNIVTSALFGGVLTKVGVYALIRLLLFLMPEQLSQYGTLTAWIAGATMLLGAFGALAQSDIRRMFGFLVISGVGVMLVALPVPQALAGAIFYALHSMLMLSGAYLLAGAIIQISGTSSLHELGGLQKKSALLSIMAFMALVSIAGLPLGSGLWPKIMVVKAGLGDGHYWLMAVLLLSSLLTILAMGRFFLFSVWREAQLSPGKRSASWESEDAGAPPIAAIAVLFSIALIMGIYPEPFIALAEKAAAGILDSSAYIHAVFPEGN